MKNPTLRAIAVRANCHPTCAWPKCNCTLPVTLAAIAAADAIAAYALDGLQGVHEADPPKYTGVGVQAAGDPLQAPETPDHSPRHFASAR